MHLKNIHKTQGKLFQDQCLTKKVVFIMTLPKTKYDFVWVFTSHSRTYNSKQRKIHI